MSQYHEDRRSSEHRNRRYNGAPSEHNRSYGYGETEKPPPYYPTSEYRSPPDKSNRYDSTDKKHFPTKPYLPETYPSNHIREEDIDSSGQSGLTPFDSFIMAVTGVVVTGGFGGIGLQFLLATARAATMGLYAAGAGATVVGTGYVVVRGGRLVISQTRPGIIGTLRAYNRVTRDVRAATASANQTVVDTTTAAARIVQSGLTSQAQGIAHVSDQAINQMVNGLNQLSNLPVQLQNMLMAAIINRASDPTPSQETPVVGEEHTEEQIQLRMEELEEGMIELVLMPHDEDLGERVDVALPTNVGLPFGSTLEQDVSRRRPLGLSDIDNVDASDADISLAHASAHEQDHESLTDGVSFVTARQSFSTAEEGDFEIVQFETE
ncbi:uncharacterized protein K444DRAFT_615699 [Hyaloscypha bicolor E]|uniref:Uncharacterized protein n=1 Tax=Hyaloscypha bicolor E TaxID=1095630 RepID=A0A2J6T2J5_9HELO|nr:uncharacterized protein K444DRAFT_615699 [Hyaloscypha bicolor E]PMD57240.1 hypothetical protein K444DRAFT_615699 [Hyaloscypha bicolor E]